MARVRLTALEDARSLRVLIVDLKAHENAQSNRDESKKRFGWADDETTNVCGQNGWALGRLAV